MTFLTPRTLLAGLASALPLLLSASLFPVASAQAQTPPAVTGNKATAKPAIPTDTPAQPASRNREPLEADRIIAVVGTDVITQHELRTRLGIAKEQLKRQNIPLPPDGQLERQMLERMIIDQAQLQLARESGLYVDDVQVDAQLEYAASSNKMSVAQFRQMLEKDNISFASVREDIRRELMISRVRDREVNSQQQASEAEIDEYLKAQQAQGNAEYQLAHILLRAPENASPEVLEKLHQKANTILKLARQGDSFASLAARFSDAPDALKGGDLGWRRTDQLPGLFAEQLHQMKDGEVSEVLRSANGFHLLKLVAQRGGAALPPVQQTLVRHILIRVNEVTPEAEAKRKLSQLRDRIERGTSFAELARLYSQDGTSAKGGDLGWIYPGDTVPDFERAMNALKPGEISPPVQSPFGFHLIQVMERRTQTASRDRLRMAAKQAILARKADEAYQDWLRQLRDRTYVELRLDEK